MFGLETGLTKSTGQKVSGGEKGFMKDPYHPIHCQSDDFLLIL
jgi:hypothetical protein